MHVTSAARCLLSALFCCSTSSQLLFFLIICNDKLKIPYVSANNSVSLSPVNCTDAAQIKADEEKAQKVAHAKQVQDAKKKEDAAAKKRREKVEHAQIQKGTVAFRFFFLKKK